MVSDSKNELFKHYHFYKNIAYKIIDIISFNIHDGVNPKETIFISGTPRSGSTWLMEILGTLPNYKTLLEPFHTEFFPEVKELGLTPRNYLDFEKDYPEIHDYIRRVIGGKKISQKPHYLDSQITNRLIADKLIVKCVRANRMLPYISKNFSLRQIYLIIRHPCAVISSQFERWATGYNMSKNLPLPKDLVINDILTIPEVNSNTILVNKIRKIDSTIELLAAIWAADNFVPLLHSKNYNWYIVPYEKLLLNEENELDKLFNAINEEATKKAKKIIREPSPVASKDYKSNVEKQLSKWRKKLSDEQINKILEITSWFGLDFYSKKLTPDYQALKNIR